MQPTKQKIVEKDVETIHDGQVYPKSYDVERCIKKNLSLLLTYKGDDKTQYGKKMLLSVEDLKYKRVSTSQIYPSKFPGGQDYRLYGYLWEPITLQ
jgi:hypothetical protein